MIYHQALTFAPKPQIGFRLVLHYFQKKIMRLSYSLHWHYKHHLESCYCVKGEGVIHDIYNGISYPVSPGTVYLLDDHDDHVFEAYEDVVLISVFNPPIVGDESHDENGVYQLKK